MVFLKVLLALPRFEPNANPPLGLGYIAAYLREKGWEVEILDPTFKGRGFAVERLEKPDFDVLGFSCFTMNYNLSRELAAIAKKANPNLVTVFGGPHPTIVPDESIKDPEVDVVCIGEGEETFDEIVGRLDSGKGLEGVKGTYFKQDGRVVRNPGKEVIKDINKLPPPARDLLPMHDYINANVGRAAWAVKQPSTSIMVGRGCPYDCTYCSTKLLLGRTLRLRNAKTVVDEIEQLVRDYGIKGLAFVDDTFTISKVVVKELCEEILRRKIKVEWVCHTRVNSVSLELLKLMKKAGCTVVAMGVESGSQEVLDRFIKKGITLQQARNAFKWARKAGLTTDAYFMIGIPGETKEQMLETIKFAKELDLDVVNFNIARPMPHTEMYEMAKKYGKITASEWDDFDFCAEPIYSTDEWTYEELQELLRKAYREFYFRPSFILKTILSIRGFSDLRKISNGLRMVLVKS